MQEVQRCRDAVLTIDTVDYNSWVESAKGRKLAAKLDKDVVLAEGTVLPGLLFPVSDGG